MSGHRMICKAKFNAVFYRLENVVSREADFPPFEAINLKTSSRGQSGARCHRFASVSQEATGSGRVLVRPSILNRRPFSTSLHFQISLAVLETSLSLINRRSALQGVRRRESLSHTIRVMVLCSRASQARAANGWTPAPLSSEFPRLFDFLPAPRGRAGEGPSV